MVWSPIEIFLWGWVTLLYFIGGGLYFYRGKQQENRNEKIILYGFGIFLISIGTSWLFFVLAELQISGYYSNHIFYGDFRKPNQNFEILTLIGAMSLALGIIILIFAFEFAIKRTKYILSLINSGLTIMIILLPFEFFYIIAIIWMTYGILIFLFILIYLTKKSQYELRTVFLLLFFGFIIGLNGWMLALDVVKELNVIPLVISPILFIISILIMISPLLINPKYFSRAFNYLLAFDISVIVFNGFLLIYFIFIDVPSYIVIANFIINIVLIYLLYQAFKILKPTVSTKESIIKEKTDIQDILHAFTRPQKLTEEEVSISKEKKICLMCKGKVGGNIFMCTDCGTFYCQKCSEALSNLENACWACDTQIDKSKPVKLPEKEEEKVIVEDFDKKGKKKI